MVGIIARDHAYPSGTPAAADPITAEPGGMTNAEKEAVAGVLAADAIKGAPVHAFDPDASPEAKARVSSAAQAQRDALPSLRKKKEAQSGTALGVDTSARDGGPTPTLTVHGTKLGVAPNADQAAAGEAIMPGSWKSWLRWVDDSPTLVGWQEVAGLTSSNGQAPPAASPLFEQYLSDQFYGAWYHNAGIILFAVLATRFITAIHLGFAWVLIILAFCAAYYSVSITRTRHRVRDDIQRELVKTRLVNETESADWMNNSMDRFWKIYEPTLSDIIIKSVDTALEASTPGFVDSIRLATFTLGTKAPRIDYVRTFPKTPDDIVIMDWGLSFTPNDLMDITPKEALDRVNPKIVLKIRLGKGFIAKDMPILLEDMSFTGRMRIKLKLTTTFPHVKTVEMSFIEKPKFDYVLKPLGGEFGFDINSIPALAPFIRDQVHNNLGPMMYDPNSFTIDLEALLSGTPLDSAIGVLEVTILAARNIKATKLGGGAPDPYVTINLGAKPVIARTKTVPSTNHPSWHEKHYILINSLGDVLNFTMWDFNDRRPDSKLGTIAKELKSLEENATQEAIQGKLVHDGKDRGELRYDLSFYPVLQPVKGPDGSIAPVPDTNTGIVRLTVHQARSLDPTGAHSSLNAYVRVYLGNNRTPIWTSNIAKRTKSPIWEASTEYLAPEKQASIVTIEVVNSEKLARDPVMGRVVVPLTQLLHYKEQGMDWLPLDGSHSGEIRLSTQWKPVQMAGSISGAHDYVPPIGILRVWLKRAIDVKNVEGTLGGKSDPYVRITGRNKVQARTLVQDNNLNPEWDEIVYFPVTNLKQHFVVELLDHQNIGKDRSLGYIDLSSKEFIMENNGEDREKYPYTRTQATRIERKERIKMEKADSYKGTLVYEVDFCPAVSLRGGVHFNDEAKGLDTTGAAHPAQLNGNGSAGESKVSLVGEAVPGLAAPLHAAAATIAANGNANGTGGANGHASKPSLGGVSVASMQTTNTANTADTKGTVESRAGKGEEATAAERDDQGVVMTRKEIIGAKAGVLVFQLIDGELPRKGRVELYVDDAVYPAFISTKSRSHKQTWDEIGEGFVREMEYSRLNLRITSGDEGIRDRDDVMAEFACDTRELLDSCIEKSTELVLASPNGASKSKIRIAMRFLPVEITLEPRESINNMGIMQMDVLSAHNLHAADRGGKSDPNITIHLNGHKVFKSETIRKTINPEWNETFECVVRSRVAAKCEFEIHDWDRVGSATHLGRGVIDLAAISPFEVQDLRIPVVHDKLGEKGTLNLRIMFQPEIVSPEPERKGTFTTAGRVVGTVGGVPLAAGRLAGKGVLLGGGAVAHGVGRGVGTVGKGVGAVGGFAGRKIGLIKKKDKEGHEVLVPADQADMDVSAPTTAGYGVPGQADGNGLEMLSDGALIPNGQRGPPPTEPGHLAVTVLGARGIKVEAGAKLKSHVAIKMGGKGHKTDHEKGVDPDWNETFTYNIAPVTNMLQIALHEHQLLGKDPVLAETEIDIWQHIDAYKTSDTIDVALPNGLGVIVLRLDWSAGTPSSNKVSRKRSMSSIATPSPAFANGVDRDGAASTTGSPGRFSALRMSMGRKHASDE